MTKVNIEINPRGLRTLFRILQCLTKFSTEILIAPLPTTLLISGINHSKSAFVRYTLEPSFFLRYEGDEEYLQYHLKVNIKPLFMILKQASNKENIISFRITTEQDRLVITLEYKNYIIKRFKLFYEEVEPIHAVYDVENSPNYWSIDATTAMDWLVHFYNKMDELSMKCTHKHLFLNSFNETAIVEYDPHSMVPDISKSDSDSKKIKSSGLVRSALGTELRVNAIDFNKYHINSNYGDISLTFSLKEFKSILTFCSFLNLNINVYFSSVGSPLIITVNQQNSFKSDFVLSTIGFEEEAMNDSSISNSMIINQNIVESSIKKEHHVNDIYPKSINHFQDKDTQDSNTSKQSKSFIPNNNDNDFDLNFSNQINNANDNNNDSDEDDMNVTKKKDEFNQDSQLSLNRNQSFINNNNNNIPLLSQNSKKYLLNYEEYNSSQLQPPSEISQKTVIEKYDSNEIINDKEFEDIKNVKLELDDRLDSNNLENLENIKLSPEDILKLSDKECENKYNIKLLNLSSHLDNLNISCSKYSEEKRLKLANKLRDLLNK